MEVNLSSARAKKARLAQLFGGKVSLLLLESIAVLLIIASLLLIFSDNNSGWYTLAIGTVLYMLNIWATHDLLWLPPNNTGDQIDQLLASDMMAKLPRKEITLQALAQLLANSPGQYFLGSRLGVTPSNIKEMAEACPDIKEVWKNALDIYSEHPYGKGIDSFHLICAVAKCSTLSKASLAKEKLSFDDLIGGLDWYIDREHLIETLQSKSRFGGLGRDWSAGYTPVLNNYGLNISYSIERSGLKFHDTSAHSNTINQLFGVFGSSGHSNIALVGDLGVGKSTTVQSFAQKLLADDNVPRVIRYNQVFVIDSAQLVSNIHEPAFVEALLNRIFDEAYRAKNIILFFDDAELLFGLKDNSINVSNAIMPMLKSGGVRAIFGFNSSDWQKLTATNPALVGLFNHQVLNEPSEAEALHIVRDQLLFLELQYDCIFTYKAVQEAYQLANRHIDYEAQPGKTIKVLEDAARSGGGKLITEEVVQQSIEATTGAKVTTANVREKSVLLNLEDKLHERMVNQKRAVNVVSAALRRARSGVSNPNRPNGTFLFLGPTGVGKTELTKALAAVYFGGADNMIRLDMNEFVNTEHVTQLITARAEVGETFLSQVRKKPFSVILFDEIEKAHPSVINVFLQMLDEGVMRDSENKVVSFRDAIIIATSNAGADEIRKHIEAGEQVEQFEDTFTNQLIESGQFKPEFLNRFDEIVIFRPLTPDELIQVARLIIGEVNKTLENKKISVEITDAAAGWLVKQGYDARLGARPLRRTIQRTVEDIVAKKILEDTLQSGQVLKLDVADLEAFQNAQSE